MRERKSLLTLVFSSLGHAYMHMLTAFFFVIVLALEADWQRPYHELVGLWTLGALLVGLLALPAGWLADRWHAPGMLTLMFLGMGVACLGCAASDSPPVLAGALALLGAFAAIYHPVGLPWVVRSSAAQGKALGINGVFGGLGVAGAGAFSGLLIDLAGWRAAFAIPGIVSILTGLALLFCLQTGLVDDGERLTGTERPKPSRGEALRVFAILLATMFCMGFIYQASQAAFPKLFDLRLARFLGEGTLGVGLIVSAVYATAALMQLIGGHLADRYPLKPIYLASFAIQVPVLAAVAVVAGAPLVAAATLAVLLSTGGLPAENMLLARYAPRRHQSLAFGFKFVLAFGTAPLAILFVSWIHARTADFFWLFVVLAALAGTATAAALALPGERRAADQRALLQPSE